MRQNKINISSLFFGLIFICQFINNSVAQNVAKYNIIYKSPAKHSWGSMVCGNGDISSKIGIDKAVNLQFNIGKTDSRKNNGKLLKMENLNLFKQYLPIEKVI